MALVLADRVQQTGTANTTVSFTLSGSVTGYQSFAVVGNGNTTYYAATDGSGNWEVGIGTYSTTGPTLTRTTILSSSNSGSAVTFPGTVNVFVTYPSEKSVNLDGSGNVSALGTVSSGVWQGTAVAVGYGGTGLTSFTAKGVVYASSTSALATGSALQFDGSNLGLGVTPSAWAGTAGKVMQINNLTMGQNIGFDVSVLTTNGYATGSTTYNYIGSASAGQYQFGGGGHRWYVAPSGTAGNAITFTQAMTLDSSGNLGIGTSSPGAYKLNVNGASVNIGATGTGNPSLQAVTTDAAGISYLALQNGTRNYSIRDEGTAGALTFRDDTAAAERMRIDSSGNLLVGTTTNTNSSKVVSSGVIESTTGGFRFPDGTTQTTAAYMGANNCLFENNMTITANYTITTGRSASSVGPITIASGKAVTIPSGSRWVIL